jgi:hypothetical protein
MRDQRDGVEVRHAWTDFRNDTMSVMGSATVTWDSNARTRRVPSTLPGPRRDDGRPGLGRGDRATPLRTVWPVGARATLPPGDVPAGSA